MNSLTPDELRERLDYELAELNGPLDLAPEALQRGRSRRRRRRAALGATTLVVAGIGGSVIGAALAGDEPSPPQRDVVATPPTADAAPDPVAEALADGFVSTEEWYEVQRFAFETTLPERYGAVSTMAHERNRLQAFATAGGDPRLQLDLVVTGRDATEDAGRDVTDWGCAAQQVARSLLDCAQAELGNGWFAVATTERTTADAPNSDGGPATHGTAMLLMNDGIWVELGAAELGWDGISSNRPAGITPGELIEAAHDPALLAAIEVGVGWHRDSFENQLRTELGLGAEQELPLASKLVHPVWPEPTPGE